jgi:hypothetical protein
MQEIVDSAEALADRFEAYVPKPEDERDPMALSLLRQAMAAHAAAERDLVAAVSTARDANYSWAAIGAMLGTSGEAARQRYAQLVAH